MFRVVPSEFDSISAGALSLPATSTLIAQPSSVLIVGIGFLPKFGLRSFLTVWAPDLMRPAPAAKPFSGRA